MYMERFEVIAWHYLRANEEQRAMILDMIPEKDRETFLMGVGLFHLLTDEAFYQRTCEALAQTVYDEFHA